MIIAPLVLAALLISEIPMFSMKFKKGSEYNRLRLCFLGVIAASAIAILALKINWSYIILLTFTAYIALNLIRALFAIRFNRK